MQIVMRLDVMMAKRKMTVTQLAKETGLSAVNITRIKNGRLQGIRFSSLVLLCDALHCKPGDLIDYMSDEEFEEEFGYSPERDE